MFALKAKLGPHAGTQPPPAGSVGEKHASTIETQILVGPVYAFRFQFGDCLALGESLIRATGEHVRRLVEQRVSLRRAQGLLGNVVLLVVVDKPARSVTLVSRLGGGRPCYYAYDDGAFYCASSLRALRHLGLPLRPDEEVLPEFFAYRLIVPPRTLLRNVQKLGAGECLQIDLGNGRVKESAWFQFRRTEGISEDDSTICARADGALRAEMATILESWPNAAVLLSGGLDSSVLAYVAKTSNPHVRSTSTSFEFVNSEDREREYALSMARQLGISHDVYQASPEDYLQGMVEAINSAEQPVHHLQSVMLYLLFRNAMNAGHDALFCGEGADMLFGFDLHFRFYRHCRLIAAARRTGAHAAYQLIARLLNITSDRWAFFARDFDPSAHTDRHVLWLDGLYGDPRIVKSWLDCDDHAIVGSRRALMRNYSDSDLLTQISVHSLLSDGFATMCIWGMLAESQQITMHYPFTSIEFMEYVLSIPWAWKLREQKHLVRGLLRGYGLPETLISRPKLAFGLPYEYWALTATFFQPLVDMAGELYGRKFLLSLQTGEPGRAMILWNAINYYLWQKLLIEDVSADSLSAEILERHTFATTRLNDSSSRKT